MPTASLASLPALASELLDRWDVCVQLKRQAFEADRAETVDHELVAATGKAQVELERLIVEVVVDGSIVSFQEEVRDQALDRDVTLPSLIQLFLIMSKIVLEVPVAVLDHPKLPNHVVNWELAVIPALGPREDLGAFVSPEASDLMKRHGLAPVGGDVVVLGAATPDDFLSWMAEPANAIAWKEACQRSPEMKPTAEAMPFLIPLEGLEKSKETHLGSFVYVVGMLCRGFSGNSPVPSPIESVEWETVAAGWESALEEWGARLSEDLMLSEPQGVWEGALAAISDGLQQIVYVHHSIGGSAGEDDDPPCFAFVLHGESGAIRLVGLFPDGQLESLPLQEDLVAFLPALIEDGLFGYDLVMEEGFDDWAEEMRRGFTPVTTPATHVQPVSRRLS